VRRAAAKLLSSLVLSRPDRLEELLPKYAPALIGRFAEREENVKMDVFATFNDLMMQVAVTRSPEGEMGVDAMAVDDAGATAAALLLAEVPRVVKAAVRQLKEKSQKTRVAAFHCVRQLASTLPGCLEAHAASVLPGIAKALADVSSNTLRIEALTFLRLCLATHKPSTFQPHVATVLPSVLALADDRYYKTVAEALRVCTELVCILRPNPPDKSFAYDSHVNKLYAVVEKRLQAQDQDQEVQVDQDQVQEVQVDQVQEVLAAVPLPLDHKLFLDQFPFSMGIVWRMTAFLIFTGLEWTPHFSSSSLLSY
jgi:cullin-associated NEDD8-dissociated protein 1